MHISIRLLRKLAELTTAYLLYCNLYRNICHEKEESHYFFIFYFFRHIDLATNIYIAVSQLRMSIDKISSGYNGQSIKLSSREREREREVARAQQNYKIRPTSHLVTVHVGH